MSVHVIICLIGIICQADAVPVREVPPAADVPESALLAQVEYSDSEDRDALLKIEKEAIEQARQRVLTKRFLQEQIKVWRIQSREMPTHLAQQALKERPQPSEIDIGSLKLSKDSAGLDELIRQNVREVALQFIREMRIPTDAWEQAYVGRAMIALLDRVYDDQLAEQDRLLAQVLVSGPRTVRELPEPRIKYPRDRDETSLVFDPKGSEDNQGADRNSEDYLVNLRRAQEDAKNRNAEDERIMWANRAVEAFYSDYTKLLSRTKSPNINKALLARLGQQLRSRDAAFEQTLAALGQLQLNQMDLRQLRLMQANLRGLAHQSRGSRKYTDYTKVQNQVQTQSSFEEQELDFSESVQDLLIKLGRQIEESGEGELPDRRERTPVQAEPEILEKTPGPND